MIEGTALPGAGEAIGGIQVRIGRVRDDNLQWEEWCWADSQWEPWNFHDPVNGDWALHAISASEVTPGYATWKVDTSSVTSWVPGLYVIGISAWCTIDGAYSSSTWVERYVGINHDITPPTVTLTTPVNGATYPNGPEIAGTAADTGGSGLDRVAVRIWLSKAADGQLYIWDYGMRQWVLWDNDDSSPSRVGIASGTEVWSLTDAPAWERGHCTVEVRAIDGRGNESPAWTVAASCLVGDLTPPTVTVIEPTSGGTYADGVPEVRGTASDGDGSGVVRVQVRLYLIRASDGALLHWNWATRQWEPYNWEPTTADQVATAEGTDSWRLAQLPEWKPGGMWVQAIATDAAGNVGECWQGCTIVSTPPTVTVVEPASGGTYADTLPEVRGTASDDGKSDIVSVQARIYLDAASGGPTQVWNWITRTWDVVDWHNLKPEQITLAVGTDSWHLPQLPDWRPGWVTVQAIATDGQGDAGECWQGCTIANTPPSVVITSPASGSVCPGGIPAIQGVSTDPTTPGLVTHVVLYRWGGPEPTAMVWNWVTGAWDPAAGWSMDWEATTSEAAWSIATGLVDWVPGEYGVSAWAYDSDGAATGAWSPFTVPVNQPPTITSVTATPSRLWPANHKMVDVVVTVTATDDTGVAPACRIVSITSSEAGNGRGDGNTAVDIEVTGPLTARLRAERSATGTGRVYTITVEAVDAAGATTYATTEVVVPHHVP